MSEHQCRQGCQCKKQVIPVIFVPDLLGTRLYNVAENQVVWDPLAGMGSYHTPLGTAVEAMSGKVSKTTAAITGSPLIAKLTDLQKLIKGLQGTLTELYALSSRVLNAVGLNSVAKRLAAAGQDANEDSKSAVAKVKAELADIKGKIARVEKEINDAFEKLGQLEEVLRIARNTWGMISVLEWMFRDAGERRKLLVGEKIGRDDELLALPQDAEKGKYDKKYYLGKTAIHPQESEERHKRGWGEVCWAQYGELLMTLQRHLDARFNLREVAQSGGTTELGSIPKPSLVTGKALKELLAAIESLFDFGTASTTTAASRPPPSTPSTTATTATAAGAAKKEMPPAWGADANYAKQMAGFAFPLHVVGYNWMQGCADGAQRLKRRITQIVGSYSPGNPDETWMTKEPVSQVIVITHGMGGQVLRALLAEVAPETDGKGGTAENSENAQSGGKEAEGKPSSEHDFSQADSTKKSDAAKEDKKNQRAQVSIKPEPNPFGKELELLKAIHVGIPQTGMPEIYAWFRAGMQTPVKSDSLSDMAVAYVTNQVLGANAAEITAVLSYSQCALEALPNNDYPKGWICWQPLPVDIVEGEKSPASTLIKLNEEIYSEYKNDIHWYKLLDKKLLCCDAAMVDSNYFNVKLLHDKTSSFYESLNVASKCLKTDKFIFGKNSKPSTRDKIVWQAQSQDTPNGDAETWVFYWQNVASENVLVKGINHLFGSNLLSKCADSGEGSVYLSEKAVCSINQPVKFVLQPGSGDGDGQVSFKSVTGGDSVECSEHHTDICQDENIRKSVYKTIQQATWDYKSEKSNDKGI